MCWCVNCRNWIINSSCGLLSLYRCPQKRRNSSGLVIETYCIWHPLLVVATYPRMPLCRVLWIRKIRSGFTGNSRYGYKYISGNIVVQEKRAIQNTSQIRSVSSHCCSNYHIINVQIITKTTKYNPKFLSKFLWLISLQDIQRYDIKLSFWTYDRKNCDIEENLQLPFSKSLHLGATVLVSGMTDTPTDNH